MNLGRAVSWSDGPVGLRRRLWLLLPAVVLFGCDVGLTLAEQTPEYWLGDYQQATEHNPLGRPLLAWHPIAFIGAAAAWGAAFSAVVLLWRHPLGGWLAVALAVGHAFGASSWLARHGVVGWASALCYVAVAAWVLRICWGRAAAEGEPDSTTPGAIPNRTA